MLANSSVRSSSINGSCNQLKVTVEPYGITTLHPNAVVRITNYDISLSVLLASVLCVSVICERIIFCVFV